MRGWPWALAVTAIVAGCDAPIGARNEAAREITEALGVPAMPLPGGVYRFVREGAPAEDSAAFTVNAVLPDTERPMFADVFVMQAHGPSQSYATSYGNIRLYPFDGETLVLELFPEVREAIYFPARIAPEAQQLVVYEYYCDVFTEQQKIEFGLEDNCRATDFEGLAAGIRALDLGALTGLRFEWMQPLPDRE